MGAERPVGESVAHTDRETEPRKKLTKAYDSDPLDRHLDEECGIEMIASNRQNRSKTQDGRALRRRAVIAAVRLAALVLQAGCPLRMSC